MAATISFGVNFSKDKSKKRFTLGDKKGAINVRLEGEKYFPEDFENQRYINELKSTIKTHFSKTPTKTKIMPHGNPVMQHFASKLSERLKFLKPIK